MFVLLLIVYSPTILTFVLFTQGQHEKHSKGFYILYEIKNSTLNCDQEALDKIIHIYIFSKQEVIRKTWMFKLTGDEVFLISSSKIDCVGHLEFEYTLKLNGKAVKIFSACHTMALSMWNVNVQGSDVEFVHVAD